MVSFGLQTCIIHVFFMVHYSSARVVGRRYMLITFSDCLKCKGYYCTHPLTCPTSTICTGSSLTNVEATVPVLIIVIKRFSKQYVELFLVGVVPLSYEKRGRFSCNWTGVQQMVSECVQHIDVHVKTHETKIRSSSHVALLAHHTQTVLSYSGTS